MPTGQPFIAGESCLLYDDRGKTHLISLSTGSEFHSDRGVVSHDAIIGANEGAVVDTSKGATLHIVRPRLADYVLRMKRGAAVMYPKDSSAVLMWADIAPGNLVLEAGTGSGATTLALSRAVGPDGSVVTVDIREDHQVHARRLVERFGGEVPPNIVFRVGDVLDVLAEIEPDRIVLDLPEPWHCAISAPGRMKPGGLLAAYVPNVPQVERLRDAMDTTKAFIEIETFEILMRSWAVRGRSVRPEHRMVGHTGFITVGRVVSA
ncbi:MAG: tRNA (adenine-N1)-methyltransferase [Acidimicrobiia bacterium]|nr:tRNA (adenine-N1)-methyltransferase [Acidimicrobiia bacterium]